MVQDELIGRWRFDWILRWVIFELIWVIDGCEIALRWISLDLSDDKSTLVQVMAWCWQAPSHYLSQCWPRSMLPYGVTRPQWVNSLALGDVIWYHFINIGSYNSLYTKPLLEPMWICANYLWQFHNQCIKYCWNGLQTGNFKLWSCLLGAIEFIHIGLILLVTDIKLHLMSWFGYWLKIATEVNGIRVL